MTDKTNDPAIQRLEIILADCVTFIEEAPKRGLIRTLGATTLEWWEEHQPLDAEISKNWAEYTERKNAYESGIQKLSITERELLNVGDEPTIDELYRYDFDPSAWNDKDEDTILRELSTMASTMVKNVNRMVERKEFYKVADTNPVIAKWWETNRERLVKSLAAQRETDRIKADTMAALAKLTDAEKEALSIA